MSSAERIMQTHKHHSEAEKALYKDVNLLGSFYFDFYQRFAPSHSETAFTHILSFGEVGETIILACQDQQQPSSNPEAYLIKQFALKGSFDPVRHWNVVNCDDFTGRGDHLIQRLILEDQDDPSASARLTLSSSGNSWESDSEAGLIGSAHFLPYKALHFHHLTEPELYEKYLVNEHVQRQLGKSALTSE